MRILIAAILFTAIALPAAAQTGTPGVDRRQYNQERRIDQGVHNGTLSKREARRLDRPRPVRVPGPPSWWSPSWLSSRRS